MQQGRILVSHDENSMPGHFHEFVAAGSASSGVLIVLQGVSNRAVIESILLVWIASDAQEWVNRIIWLPL